MISIRKISVHLPAVLDVYAIPSVLFVTSTSPWCHIILIQLSSCLPCVRISLIPVSQNSMFSDFLPFSILFIQLSLSHLTRVPQIGCSQSLSTFCSRITSSTVPSSPLSLLGRQTTKSYITQARYNSKCPVLSLGLFY